MTDPTPADRGHIKRVPLDYPLGLEPSALHLPASLTSFVGREREVAAVADLLRQSDVRLVTLTGPGGVGKTRLALQVAGEVAADFPDDIWFVTLAPIRDSDLVLPTIARALDVPAGDELVAKRLAAHVGTAKCLLLLDNFEQVVEAAPAITHLLAGCPGLRALVTSRARLRVGAERVFPVPPLGLPDLGGTDVWTGSEAVALFLERVRAVDPDFAPVGDEAGAVAEICRRLDGLPLAIELAAARVLLLLPRAMLDRLEKRLPMLTGGTRDGPARQRTMGDAIAWTHDMLSAEEQAIFRRLAIFVGGFTLEAAEAVADDARANGDVFVGIEALAGQSLVRRLDVAAGEPRYAMLETVREYGLEHLAASGEEDGVRARHAAWCLAFAEKFDIIEPVVTDLDRLERDLPNFRLALAWAEETWAASTSLRLAGALHPLWMLRNHRTEGRRWLKVALSRDAGTASVARAAALISLSILEHAHGDTELGLGHLEEGLALARALGDFPLAAFASSMLVSVTVGTGADDRAMSLIPDAEERCAGVGDAFGIALLRVQRGLLAHRRGDLEQAVALFTEALALARDIGSPYVAAIALELLAFALGDRGEYGRAAALYSEALTTWRDVGTNEGLVDWLALVASLAAALNKPERAVRWFGTVEAQSEILGFNFPLPERARFARIADDVRTSLGDAAVAASAAGRVLSLEQATTEAAVMLAEQYTSKHRGDGVDSATRAGLTPRECEVLRLLAAGHSDRAIAAALFVSPHTASAHVRNILAKLGVESRTAAAAYAFRQGLIEDTSTEN